MTGLIDWGNVMFTHPEYDVAISHMIMSIGPQYLDGNLPQRYDLRAAVEWAMASTWQRTERNVRSMTAFSSITVRCVRHMPTRKLSLPGQDVDLPYTARDGYSWQHPVLFAVVRNLLEKTTGVAIEPL